MHDGGKLDVRCENVVLGESVGLPLRPGRYTRIVVKDEGIGIAEEHLPRIFDPYFTTRPDKSGLGLAICYSVIKQHEGSITAESCVGVGTTITIYLPATTEVARTDEGYERIEEIPPSKRRRLTKGRVLIMDDEEIIRDVVARMLEQIGYDVDAAKDGAEAIQMYQDAVKQDHPFDVVIMDLTIPGGMGGRDAIRQLLEIDPRAKAIVSSGYSNDKVMSHFHDYGFKGVVAKPYTIDELNNALDVVINA